MLHQWYLLLRFVQIPSTSYLLHWWYVLHSFKSCQCYICYISNINCFLSYKSCQCHNCHIWITTTTFISLFSKNLSMSQMLQHSYLLFHYCNNSQFINIQSSFFTNGNSRAYHVNSIKIITSNDKVKETKPKGELIKDIHDVNFNDHNESHTLLCCAGILGKLDASLLELHISFLSTKYVETLDLYYQCIAPESIMKENKKQCDLIYCILSKLKTKNENYESVSYI